MEETATGSCLCGGTRFRILGPFERFYLCHCSRCRKDTGSAHAANLFSSSATIEWLAGEDNITVFALPGTRHVHGFCRICGSALPTRYSEAGTLVVPAGALDGDVALRPDAHILYADRATWDEALEAVVKYDGLP